MHCNSSLPPPFYSPVYFDSAASYTITPRCDLIVPSSWEQLPRPISLQGAGSLVSLTHKVKVKFLPATGGMNVAYYAPLMSATLIGMGHLQASGAVWGCDPARPRTHILIHRFPGGPLIGSACRTSSNMYPADIPGLTRAHSEAEYCGIAVARSPPPGLSPSSI